MKKFLITIVFAFVFLFKSFADEGMWLPLLLGQQVYNDMVKKGLKLTKEQLYSINKASLKDAIVIFGGPNGGCTGEIVSSQGLIFTNHHCGYDVIASASTIDHNYLRDGFYATSKADEIVAEGIQVQFLLKIEDITKEVMDSLQGLSGRERVDRQNRVLSAINGRLSDPSQNIDVRVSSLFKGNQFLAFYYQRFKDVRLVGAPPESIGKFGGDTDNWEWPRHTGDYSIFRVYMTKDGKPSNEFSKDNVPLKPKWYLPVSIKGFKDGDFAMIYGYPGRTNRYETSYGVKQKIDIDNPTLVKLRDMRLKYMFEEMKKDPKIRLQLASSYATIANYWKFYDGESKQLVKYDVYGQKKKAEATFIDWAKGKPEYQNIFSDWEKAYAEWRPYSKLRVYINEGFAGSPLLAFASNLIPLYDSLYTGKAKQANLTRLINNADRFRKMFLEEENKPSDQNIVGSVLKLFYEDIPQEQHPIGFYNTLRNNYGDLKDDNTYKKFAAAVFSNTMIFDDAKWSDFIAHPDVNKLAEDPAYSVASTFFRNYLSKYSQYFQQFTARNNELGRLYLKGIMEMNPAKAKMMYPDATSTMRVSYGNVKSYNPRDGVRYSYVTTAKGVLEKYVPNDYEFDLPAKAIELMKKRDFGQYIDKTQNDLVVGFITTNDITGGNSGSPVMNAKGELIGLAFDGNYEALSHQIAFDKDLNRTINVDIRYVLWCIDKLGGAGSIIKELDLR